MPLIATPNVRWGEAKVRRQNFPDGHFRQPFPSLPASLQFSKPGPAVCEDEAKTETPGKCEPLLASQGTMVWHLLLLSLQLGIPLHAPGTWEISDPLASPLCTPSFCFPCPGWGWIEKGRPLSCLSLEGAVLKLTAQSRVSETPSLTFLPRREQPQEWKPHPSKAVRRAVNLSPGCCGRSAPQWLREKWSGTPFPVPLSPPHPWTVPFL